MQASAHAPTITQGAAVETFTKVCRPTYQTLVIDQGCDAICYKDNLAFFLHFTEMQRVYATRPQCFKLKLRETSI